jgi:glycosyltransferase involved in cell wall biosynthesis
MSTDRDAQPLVSVITPFYNTAPYLAECIEGVLAQTYANFEYLLVNNQSTDDSRAIAARYLGRDPRVRLVDTTEFLGQIPNYNAALERASPNAKYVKMAQADDVLFPDCLARMVGLAEHEPTVGIVSSYYLYGEDLEGRGVPYQVGRLPGREACRQMLLSRISLTGSQTTVLYRADVVRARRPFFTPGRLHPDSEVAFDILLDHDLGYVHQVLSFSRADNPSIMTAARPFNPMLLNYVILMEGFGARVLSPEEFARARSGIWRDYSRYLAQEWWRRREPGFWEYHRRGLATLGRALRRRDVLPWVLEEALRMALNPETTSRRVLGRFRRTAMRPPSHP